MYNVAGLKIRCCDLLYRRETKSLFSASTPLLSWYEDSRQYSSGQVDITEGNRFPRQKQPRTHLLRTLPQDSQEPSPRKLWQMEDHTSTRIWKLDFRQ